MSKAVRVCFVGDSFVNGTGDPACLGWTGRVCAHASAQGHDVTYYNLGIRRETSSDIRARWRAEVDCRLPREFAGAVVFSFGVNDARVETVSPRVAPKNTVENATEILREAKALWPVLFVGPPPIDDAEQNARISTLDAAMSDAAASLSIPYLSVFDHLAQAPLWMTEVRSNDGAHPSAGGYEAFAQLVRTWPAWQAWFD